MISEALKTGNYLSKGKKQNNKKIRIMNYFSVPNRPEKDDIIMNEASRPIAVNQLNSAFRKIFMDEKA